MLKNIVIEVVSRVLHNDIVLIKEKAILLFRLLSSFVHFEVFNKRDLTKLLVDLKSLRDYEID